MFQSIWLIWVMYDKIKNQIEFFFNWGYNTYYFQSLYKIKMGRKKMKIKFHDLVSYIPHPNERYSYKLILVVMGK